MSTEIDRMIDSLIDFTWQPNWLNCVKLTKLTYYKQIKNNTCTITYY